MAEEKKPPEAPEKKKIKIAPGTTIQDGKPDQGKEEKPKEEKPKKDPSYEENRISQEEFAELEKKEGKPLKAKGKKEERLPAGHKASDVDMLLLKTEKMEGKFEAMEEGIGALEERLSGMNQEIGELRSSLMEKDRMMREFQAGFAKVKEVADGMEPEKIATQFAKKEEEIEKILAELESEKVQLKQTREEVKLNKSTLQSLRDVKRLVETIGNLKSIVDKVEEDRKFASRTAGKIESMFSDLASKLAEFQSYKDKIAFNEETMHEIMKTMDSIETKLQETVKKDDLKKMQGTVDERFEKVDTQMDDKVFEIKNLMDELLENLKQAGIKGVLETVGKSKLDQMFATKEDLEAIRKKLGTLRKDTEEMAESKEEEFQEKSPEIKFASRGEPKARASETGGKPIPQAPARQAPASSRGPVQGIRQQIDSSIDQAEEALKMGQMDVAKNLYREALGMYNQLNRAENMQEASQVYERIRRLYSRLRIYS